MAEELVGIIGGTGLGDALAEQMSGAERHDVDTPFGKASGAILVGKFGNKKIAFLSRHGDGHALSPSEVPFAANIFALKKLGVRAIISSAAVGSLREQMLRETLSSSINSSTKHSGERAASSAVSGLSTASWPIQPVGASGRCLSPPQTESK
jgi:5'-methylthioadenosine phosphorylase